MYDLITYDNIQIIFDFDFFHHVVMPLENVQMSGIFVTDDNSFHLTKIVLLICNYYIYKIQVKFDIYNKKNYLTHWFPNLVTICRKQFISRVLFYFGFGIQALGSLWFYLQIGLKTEITFIHCYITKLFSVYSIISLHIFTFA